MLAIEIISVISAIAVLILSGVMLVRKVVRLGKTGRSVQMNVEPKAMALITQSDSAQRRAFSIMEGKDMLLARLDVLRVSVSKLKVLMTATREAWTPVARVLNYLGL